MSIVGEEEVWPGLKVTRSKSAATPQRDAGGGIALSGGLKILRRGCGAGRMLLHSTVLRGSQKDVNDVKVM